MQATSLAQESAFANFQRPVKAKEQNAAANAVVSVSVSDAVSVAPSQSAVSVEPPKVNEESPQAVEIPKAQDEILKAQDEILKESENSSNANDVNASDSPKQAPSSEAKESPAAVSGEHVIMKEEPPKELSNAVEDVSHEAKDSLQKDVNPDDVKVQSEAVAEKESEQKVEESVPVKDAQVEEAPLSIASKQKSEEKEEKSELAEKIADVVKPEEVQIANDFPVVIEKESESEVIYNDVKENEDVKKKHPEDAEKSEENLGESLNIFDMFLFVDSQSQSNASLHESEGKHKHDDEQS